MTVIVCLYVEQTCAAIQQAFPWRARVVQWACGAANEVGPSSTVAQRRPIQTGVWDQQLPIWGNVEQEDVQDSTREGQSMCHTGWWVIYIRIHPRRRNVTTSMVKLKNSHICKNLTQKGEPQRSSWGTQKKILESFVSPQLKIWASYVHPSLLTLSILSPTWCSILDLTLLWAVRLRRLFPWSLDRTCLHSLQLQMRTWTEVWSVTVCVPLQGLRGRNSSLVVC